jgi:hypothetical protein
MRPESSSRCILGDRGFHRVIGHIIFGQETHRPKPSGAYGPISVRSPLLANPRSKFTPTTVLCFPKTPNSANTPPPDSC